MTKKCVNKSTICPITYQPLQEDEKNYSKQGLKLLSPKLKNLNMLECSAQEQRLQALNMAGKMSIQGVQSKLSAKLNIKIGKFDFCTQGGTYILKPQSEYYPELPENEDLTMRLASMVNIEVPLHGMVYSIDGSLTYFIKRFDRYGKNKKMHIEDFAQLSGHNRNTKYRYSMEQVVNLVEQFCTFPALEKKKLFIRLLFNYLVGNEDMHLKNYSLITRKNKVELAPAYDFLNSTIVIPNCKEEIALPLKGKKNNLTRRDLIDYFGGTKLNLNSIVISEVISLFQANFENWFRMLDISFLSEKYKDKYRNILISRMQVLGL